MEPAERAHGFHIFATRAARGAAEIGGPDLEWWVRDAEEGVAPVGSDLVVEVKSGGVRGLDGTGGFEAKGRRGWGFG